MRYLIMILAGHLLIIFASYNSAYANHPGYDCFIDNGMHCSPGSEGEPNITNSEPEPDGDNDQDTESPR